MKKALQNLVLFALFIYGSSCNQQVATHKQIIKDQGVNIDYTDTGHGDTTLLFVHGWCLNKTYWSNQVQFFEKRYRVVTIDLPGFGKSGTNRNTWNTTSFGRDVQAVIQQLKLSHVILIGHSMAGDIILQAAIDEPKAVIGLVGVDNFKSVGIGNVPTKKDSDDYAKLIDTLKHNFKKIAFAYFNQDLFYKTTTKAIKLRILNDVSHTDSTIAAACMEQDKFDEATELKRANKKLCLINSDVKATNTQGLKNKGIPFQIWYIHATGHFPMVEAPDKFNELLAQAILKIS